MLQANIRGDTYDDWVHERCPIAALLEKGEYKGNSSGTQQDQDQLVFELFKDEFPNRSARIFWQCCCGVSVIRCLVRDGT